MRNGFVRRGDLEIYQKTVEELNGLVLNGRDKSSKMELLATVNAHAVSSRGLFWKREKFPMSIYCPPGIVLVKKTYVGYEIEIPADLDFRKMKLNLPIKYWDVKIWKSDKETNYSVMGIFCQRFSKEDSVHLGLYEESPKEDRNLEKWQY